MATVTLQKDWSGMQSAYGNMSDLVAPLITKLDRSIGERQPGLASPAPQIEEQLLVLISRQWGKGSHSYVSALGALAQRGTISSLDDIPKANELLLAAHERAKAQHADTCEKLANPAHTFGIMATFLGDESSLATGFRSLDDLRRLDIQLKPDLPFGFDPGEVMNYQAVLVDLAEYTAVGV